MSIPENLMYTAEHEWVAIEGTTASVGITDFAQQALGDVVYVSVPAAGTEVTGGEPCGEVESTKSVSDLYSPVDGEVTEVNEELDDDPGLVNAEPYGAGGGRPAAHPHRPGRQVAAGAAARLRGTVATRGHHGRGRDQRRAVAHAGGADRDGVRRDRLRGTVRDRCQG